MLEKFFNGPVLITECATKVGFHNFECYTMGKRQGEKGRLFLSAKRRKCNNLVRYNRCKQRDLPFLNKEMLKIANFPKLGDDNNSGTSKNVIENLNVQASSSVTIDKSTPYDDFETVTDILEPEISDTTQLSDDCQNIEISGRRIIQFQYFFDSLKNISDHGKHFGCTLRNLEVVNETRFGLNSRITLKCNMCNETFQIFTNPFYPEEEANTMDINMACVEGTVGIGGGFYNLEEFVSSLEIPCMNHKTYQKYHDAASTVWESLAVKEMQKASEREKEIALEKGNIDADGTACITVVADGCWSKRSYRTNYSALSGAAAIIGLETGQVLYLGVKNKYCIICLSAKEKGEEAKSHTCWKNYKGSSTSMESAIIIEGFQRSMEMYGLKYTKLVADGDSSTYKKLLEARPYKNTTIEKIECRNHLLRNYCNKLKTLTTDTRYPLKFRKVLTNQKIMKLRTAVKFAIKYRKNENKPISDQINLLKKDVDNSIFHVFGSHSCCSEYYCKGEKNEENVIQFLQTCTNFYNKLLTIVKQLSLNCRSLIYDLDSNVVEQFNSKVAKFVGGKRVNFSKRNSYQTRCFLAALSHNTKRPHYYFHKNVVCKSPSKIKSKFEIKRLQKAKRQLYKSKPFKHNTNHQKMNADPDYGVCCQQPDMDVEEFEKEKELFLKTLQRTVDEKESLERSTVLQSGSGLWLEERRKLLTSSNFYSVCVRLPTTSCVNLVRKLLYDSSALLQHVDSIRHGRENEERARLQLEKELNKPIKSCGLFVDNEFPFLGASPDGLVADDTTIEIKCPFSAFNLPIMEAIQQRKVTFWRKDNTVNTRHSWYYQVQGQLRITNRQTCILAVWTSENAPLKTEYINRDDAFWKNNMQTKLVNFYMDCLLPEIIDPRHSRNMRIRDPEYIIAAINKQKDKNMKKMKNGLN